MGKMTEYTLELYKTDRRTKEGRRLVEVKDIAESTRAHIESIADSLRKLDFIVEVFETYVTKKNSMTGQEFQERYDRPYYCSPSSETYWSS